MVSKKLSKRLKEVEKKSRENYDLYLRALAELENVKKRILREKEEYTKFANESLIKDILPVIDSLEKAIDHTNDEKLVEGIQLTLDNLMSVLKKKGLEQINILLGDVFDTNFHEAISKTKSDMYGSGYIVKELQKGYLLNGRLIRPSMVIVS